MGKLAVASWIVAGVAAAASAYLYFQLDSEHEHNVALDNRLTQLEQSRHVEPANSVAVEKTFTPNSSVADVSMAQSAAPAEKKPSLAQQRREKFKEAFRDRLSDADSRAKMHERQKTALMRTHADLANALRLSPEDADKFFDLLAEQRIKGAEKNMELRELLEAQNLPKDEITKRLKQNADAQKLQTDKQVALAFGDTKGQQWKDYEASADTRAQVQGLQTMLRSSGMPLRDDQTEQLVNALKSSDPKKSGSDAGEDVGNGSMALDPNQRIAKLEEKLSQQEQKARQQHSTLSQYLTPEQLRRSDQIAQQQLDNQRKMIQRLRDRS